MLTSLNTRRTSNSNKFSILSRDIPSDTERIETETDKFTERSGRSDLIVRGPSQTNKLENSLATQRPIQTELPKKVRLGSLKEKKQGRSMYTSTHITTLDTQNNFIIQKTLIDSGCTSSCIDKDFVEMNKSTTKQTPEPIPVTNADGTKNQGGDITKYVSLMMTIGSHTEKINLVVTQLGKDTIFLGHDWLRFHNPRIDWKKEAIEFTRCPSECNMTTSSSEELTYEPENGEQLLYIEIPQSEIRLRAFQTASQRFAEKEESEKHKTRNIDNTVPSHYQQWRKVFEKEKFDELPPKRPWDHAIDLVPNAGKSLTCKVYPLNAGEQGQLQNFLNENLESGRIRPSMSEIASPFFFIKKKDGSLRPVQDYRKLNEITVKNCYPYH